MKQLWVTLVAIVLATSSVLAQTEAQTPQEKIGKAVSKAYKSTKKQVNKGSHQVGEALGLEAKGNEHDADDVKIKGYYYMPLYDTNLYNGAESQEFRAECLKLFQQQYPTLEVLSVAIPQTDWVQENVTQNNRVLGYGQYLYCFIIAKDGNDGYVNARFAYRKYKEVGGEFLPIETIWPKWERTDVIPAAVYAKLVKM